MQDTINKIMIGPEQVRLYNEKCDRMNVMGEKFLRIIELPHITHTNTSSRTESKVLHQDPSIDIDSIGVCTNAITGTLKNFFKLLPESLIPEKLLTPLLDIPGSSNINDQIEKMKEIYSALPRANLKTLRFLCEHLNKVQQNNEVNKMSASNLSIVFWPTLMRPPILDMANPTKQLGWQLAMAKMIEHPECVPQVD